MQIHDRNSSRVVRYLRSKYSSLNTPIVSVFFRYGDTKTQDPSTVLRSILVQLVKQSGRKPPYLKTLPARSTIENLWTIVCNFIASFQRAFIVLDALDEYASGPSAFMNQFERILHLPQVNLFITSRPIHVDKSSLGDYEELEIKASGSAIERYIQQKLYQSARFKKIDDHVRTREIVHTIARRSQGR